MEEAVCRLFLDFSMRKLQAMVDTMSRCLGMLDDEQVWRKHGAHENAVGNLVLHLCGNMRQWVLHGIRGDANVRERDGEFAANGGKGAAELASMFTTTVAEAVGVIETLPCARLLERINPQNGELPVLDAIYHVAGHVQQHVGQVILLTKQMIGTDLDLTMPRKR